MAKKPKDEQQENEAPKDTDQKNTPTWQEIAEAQKPLSQKAIERLDDPNKRLIAPKEDKFIEKQLKIKTQPDPTHTIVTELSAPRQIQTANKKAPTKKVLKSKITQQGTRKLSPEEIEKLKQAMILGLRQEEREEPEEDSLLKPLVDLAKKIFNPFAKKPK